MAIIGIPEKENKMMIILVVFAALVFLSIGFTLLFSNKANNHKSSCCTHESVLTPEELPEELKKYKPFYDIFGYPKRTIEDNSGNMILDAKQMASIYGSTKAAVVYNPGCLNGASWRVCGLDETGEYETFSMNIFGSQEDAVKWCCIGGYQFTIVPYEKHFKSISQFYEDQQRKAINESLQETTKELYN